jgi:hypothetical protein
MSAANLSKLWNWAVELVAFAEKVSTAASPDNQKKIRNAIQGSRTFSTSHGVEFTDARVEHYVELFHVGQLGACGMNQIAYADKVIE